MVDGWPWFFLLVHKFELRQHTPACRIEFEVCTVPVLQNSTCCVDSSSWLTWTGCALHAYARMWQNLVQLKSPSYMPDELRLSFFIHYCYFHWPCSQFTQGDVVNMELEVILRHYPQFKVRMTLFYLLYLFVISV